MADTSSGMSSKQSIARSTNAIGHDGRVTYNDNVLQRLEDYAEGGVWSECSSGMEEVGVDDSCSITMCIQASESAWMTGRWMGVGSEGKLRKRLERLWMRATEERTIR
ncbi:hypothetical protein N7G274_000514 [Stereocaulon virgatum]|uniref:Uncharacterized protein n=1 Tax=Stereocaulon virgatum TaxID=373712 RepID=A0ABR4AUP6_9LECA